MADAMHQALRSTDHRIIAHTLADVLVAEIRANPAHGGAEVADAVDRLRQAVWAEEGDAASASDVFDAVLAQFPISQRTQLVEAYARLGHLYELAGQVARENLMEGELGGRAPGGAREFVARAQTAAEAVSALNHPTFEVVMTAHPTNVNGRAVIASLKVLGKAVDAVRSVSRASALERAMNGFLLTPLLEQESGQAKVHLAVNEETSQMLYYLGNIYDELPMIYEGFEEPLRAFTDYDPRSLDLKLRFGSWGSSGDKDGNLEVNAVTTLQAIAQHRAAIAGRYLADIRQIPALQAWEAPLAALEKTAQEVVAHLHNHPHISSTQFDTLSQRLAAAAPDADALQRSIERVSAQSAEALALLRRVRVFGLGFGKIEYRENADEYTRVVSAIIPGYAELSPDARRDRLNTILQTPGEAARLKDAVWKKISAAADSPYAAEDVMPIAYHTLKRMELARDHAGMVTDNVLAEFSHPSQLLEALFLQKAVESPGKNLALGVVPLFESPQSMESAPSMMLEAYHVPAYRQHVEALGKTQQIQIAHSDNARRSGLPAARAFIFEAHDALRQVGDREGLATQFFEGGSSSDLYRGGVCSISVAVKNYNLHDFAKFTFQGGDMLNYFNYAPSIRRQFVRAVVSGAETALPLGRPLAKSGLWRHRSGQLTNIPEQEAAANALVVPALKATLNDYLTYAFTTAGLGHLLKELGYDEEKEAGTAGSRTPSRPAAVVFSNVASVQAVNLEAAAIGSVDIEKTRTITFSEALQHAGLVPTMIGARTILANLQREMVSHRQSLREGLARGDALGVVDSEFMKLFPLRDAQQLDVPPPQAVQFLFDHSRLFRDVVVRIALGVALTDFDAIRTHHPRLKNDPFLDQLEEECRSAASLCCAALTGQYPETLLGKKRMAEVPTATLRSLVAAQFPELEPVLADKSRYRQFIQSVKADLRQAEGSQTELRRLLHAAGDTVTHGRFLPADDSAYGTFLRQQYESNLPGVTKMRERER